MPHTPALEAGGLGLCQCTPSNRVKVTWHGTATPRPNRSDQRPKHESVYVRRWNIALLLPRPGRPGVRTLAGYRTGTEVRLQGKPCGGRCGWCTGSPKLNAHPMETLAAAVVMDLGPPTPLAILPDPCAPSPAAGTSFKEQSKFGGCLHRDVGRCWGVRGPQKASGAPVCGAVIALPPPLHTHTTCCPHCLLFGTPPPPTQQATHW